MSIQVINKYMKLHINTKKEDLQLAKKLLKEYQKKGDQKNIKICLANIKEFSK